VMFVGQPGSGKSTFARMLGKATGLPVVHVLWMDDSIESA
jgi:adenylate kinase family enzyme